MNKIKVVLSERGIKDAIKELKYQKRLLEYKNQLIVQRLAELGERVARSRAFGMGDSKTDDIEWKIDSSVNGSTATATLTMSGQEIFFVEFGAGAHYNGPAGTSTSSLNDELGLGFTIGSYGKGYGANDYWFYYDESGEKHFSQGTKASLQMTTANKEIRDQAIQIVREVLEDGNIR